MTRPVSEVEHLVDAGENRQAIARRLGIEVRSLYRWCKRNGRLDLWRRAA